MNREQLVKELMDMIDQYYTEERYRQDLQDEIEDIIFRYVTPDDSDEKEACDHLHTVSMPQHIYCYDCHQVIEE